MQKRRKQKASHDSRKDGAAARVPDYQYEERPAGGSSPPAAQETHRTLRTGGKKKKNKEMTTKTKILVPHGVVSQMERERYGSRPTIRKALRHDYNEQNDEERNRALRIRRRAMQLGGVVMVDEGAHSVQPTAKED